MQDIFQSKQRTCIRTTNEQRYWDRSCSMNLSKQREQIYILPLEENYEHQQNKVIAFPYTSKNYEYQQNSVIAFLTLAKTTF